MIYKIILFINVCLLMGCQEKDPRNFVGIKMNPVYERDMAEWAEKNKLKMISSAPWYPIKINIGHQWSRGKIRIRGDVARHWRNPSKSFRIRLKNSLWKGMNEFDLIIPEDKGFELEAVAYEWAKILKIPVPNYEFVDVQLNHKKLGSYFVVERWTDASFISRGQNPGEIISENNAWLNSIDPGFKSLYKNVSHIRDSFNPLSLEPAIYTTSLKRTQSQQAMTKFSGMLLEMKKTSDLSWEKYLDREASAKWAALLIYMGSIHGSFGDNVRWIYSAEKKTFMPIIYDVLAYSRQVESGECLSAPFIKSNAWIAYWMRDDFMKKQIAFWIEWMTKEKSLVFEQTLASISKRYRLKKWSPTQQRERDEILQRIRFNINTAQRHLAAQGCL